MSPRETIKSEAGVTIFKITLLHGCNKSAENYVVTSMRTPEERIFTLQVEAEKYFAAEVERSFFK